MSARARTPKEAFSGGGYRWNARSTALDDARIVKYAIDTDSAPLSCANVIELWQNDAAFRAFFIALLAQAPFAAFRWETAPLTRNSAGQPFEFVLVDSPELACAADSAPFAEHFVSTAADGIAVFPNIGGDAVLVAPCAASPSAHYAHLAAFLRQSPASQQHSLWQAVGATMQRRLDSRPVWLSTAGGGVAWLHVRLDDRPKYYAYAPYRNAAGRG